jgi:phosphohistidine phosphatase SixA
VVAGGEQVDTGRHRDQEQDSRLMLTLLLMRHAKSDWDANYNLDHDRPLNGRGERSARLMGRVLTGLDHGAARSIWNLGFTAVDLTRFSHWQRAHPTSRV